MTWDYDKNEELEIRIDWKDRAKAVQYKVVGLHDSEWTSTPFQTYEFRTTDQVLNRINIWLGA